MPSLLHKLSFFDPEVGRYFVVASDGFYWKEAKKSPEDSKVTKLLAQYGWQLRNGNDVWLIFRRPRTPGELFVIRGEKRWYYDLPDSDLFDVAAEGRGLDSLQQAIESGKLPGAKAKGMTASPTTTAVNNAGNGHGSMPDDQLEPDTKYGMMGRPDYGSGYTGIMNELNAEDDEWSKEASILVLNGSVKMGSTTAETSLYVTGAEYQGLTLTKFTFSPDRHKAKIFPKLTAQNLSQQIFGKFATVARVVLAADYREMFKATLALDPKYDKVINREIEWAKRVLKKQDRIVWYLRWVRLACVHDMLGRAHLDENPAGVTAAAAAPAPAPNQPQQPAQQQKKPQTRTEQIKALYQQYDREMTNKSGGGELVTLTDLVHMKQSLEHFYSLHSPEIDNYSPKYESWNDLYGKFSVFEQAWKEEAGKALKPKEGDEIWIQFPDGWAWWHLPRASCEDEAAAMGHCGNSPNAKAKGVSILSLRRPIKRGNETRWEPHLTFILHGTVLGEMKGKGNDKPAPQYHKYIIPLLLDKRITGVGGGGYLAEHNFSMNDLTPEQRAEISKAKPSMGMSLSGYYKAYGMDDTLAARIKAILGMDSATYDPQWGFALRSWDTREDFLDDVGDSEASKAATFVQTGEHDYDDPDIDELTDLLDGFDEVELHNLGLQLQYDYPREMREWYANFNPNDRDALKMALTDLYNAYIKGAKAQHSNQRKGLEKKIKELEANVSEDPAAANEVTPLKEKLKNLRLDKVWEKVPALLELYSAYLSGGPDQNTVDKLLREALERGVDESGTEIRRTKDGKWLQLLSEEQAVADAEAAQNRHGTGGYYEAPEINVSIPYDWDEFDEERARESAKEYFSRPPKRPEVDKRQRRLFPEPKTEESAKRHGITVSHAKNPLLRRKSLKTKV
jgi:hypothetical protein